MPRPRRLLQQTAQIYTSPLDALTETQSMARVGPAHGNMIYQVTLPSKEPVLVELPGKFRNLVYMRRGGFVVVDTKGEHLAEGRDNKIYGEITHIVMDEKAWRKKSYWPKEFGRLWEPKPRDDRAGKMPTDSEDNADGNSEDDDSED